MNKRPGFHLVETIVVMAILPLVLVIFTQIFQVFSHEMPWGNRVVEENTVLLNLLKQLHQDLQQGRQVALASDTNDTPLTIKTDTETLVYRILPEVVMREISSESRATRTWHLKHGRVHWRLSKQFSNSPALEVHTYVRQALHGRRHQRLANAHLFYIGSNTLEENLP